MFHIQIQKLSILFNDQTIINLEKKLIPFRSTGEATLIFHVTRYVAIRIIKCLHRGTENVVHRENSNEESHK